MTDQEKLQKLFDAALRDPSEAVKAPTRVSPTPPVFESQETGNTDSVSEPSLKQELQPTVMAGESTHPNHGLDHKTSTELGLLLDEQNRRKSQKARRGALITLVTLIGVVGGGTAWFVSSPDRVKALKSAISEVRSAGDITAILAKYQKAVDAIGNRSKQIDAATESMGVSSDQSEAEDPNMDAEMQAMMRGEGKTVGQRNKLLQDKLGKIAEATRNKVEHDQVPASTNSPESN